ncbi:MAG: type III-B CRISPR module RAMP protein Cmr1 [Deltaproteobacteria bacterium]|nr:type III-B CRISPR module RAMP protein Cmr1 [Deltaproteobacteria bacterium]
MEIRIRTLTPLGTGGGDQTCDRLHETGIIGSLRWWYEALVRGLGGYACDSTGDDRCEYDPKKPVPPENQLCAACHLFGCTGWGRKFRLRVLDTSGQVIQNAVHENTEMVFEFVEVRPIGPEEKWLLTKAIEIAAKYGALGGKTTYKPQKGPMGKDFGIVEWVGASDISRPADVKAILKNFRNVQHLPEYPNLAHFFFFLGAFLSRVQMNPLLGLDNKGKPLSKTDEVEKFLQGKRGSAQSEAVSKKLFSFQADGGRIWGYAKEIAMRNQIVDRIKQQLQLGKVSYTVKVGEEVIHEL